MIQGQSPIVVTGNGSVQQPIVISLSVDGKTGCAGIVACLAGSLGPGLRYDSGTGRLQLKLSTDSGQVARFGPDQGLLVTNDGGGPGPQACTHGIDSLPAAPGVVAAESLAGFMGPYSSPYQLDYCLGAGVDIVSFHVATSADDVGVVADYWDHKIPDGRTDIYVTSDIRKLNAAVVHSTLNYAGDENDPVAYQSSPPVRTDRRGGWYGYLAARYYQPLLGDFLQRIDGKAVAMLDCSVDPVNGNPSFPETVAIIGAIRGVLKHCAQSWAMIAVQNVSTAQTVQGYGITPALIPVRPVKWNDPTMPYPVVDLTSNGIQWIVLSNRCSDSVLKAYQDAGVNVLVQGGSRHVDRARVERLGLRGGYAMDPVYYRGPKTDMNPSGYRSEEEQWQHRKVGLGQFSHRSDATDVLSSGGYVRGRPSAAEPGLIVPTNFGSGLGRPTILFGSACPMQNPSAYTLKWGMKWTVLATVSSSRAKMGLLFGAATDADTLEWPQNDAVRNPMGLPEGQKLLYRAFQRQNGEIGLAKWTALGFTYLATLSTPAIPVNTWNSYQLDVTPTQLTFTRIRPDGTRHTVTAADSTYRGPYFFIEKEEGTAADTANLFEGMFRSLVYTPGA
ncbi:hypothetical protein ACFPC0_11145 [Streptomyces andamanensis]|uniref:Uncharacterized protein n=1 Tax=Streptomyces andamanensis TaxID=1565035 RepID=A0ABV8TCX6_9ACTN